MDSQISDLVDQAMPHFNPQLCEGLAVEEMKNADRYVDSIFRSAAAGFPEGLEYLGYRRCTPQEMYTVMTRKHNGSGCTYESAPNTVYMIEVNFSFKAKGETKAAKLDPQYLLLPYVLPGGLINIRGPVYAISPVLADKAISVDEESIFVPLYRDKLKFRRVTHHYLVNGARETTYVVWCDVHQKLRKIKKATRIYTTMAHYMFCRYGVVGAFKKFCNADIVVGTDENITVDNYPADEWVICQTIGNQPKAVPWKFYTATRLRVAIPKEQWSIDCSKLMGGLFYCVDHFPTRIVAEDIEELHLWRVLLGSIIEGMNVSEGKMAESANNHMVSLRDCLDNMSKEDLKSEQIFAEDIYELFAIFVFTLDARVINNSSSIGSMYNKQLSVLRYVLFNISSAIYTMMYNLLSIAGKKELTALDIRKVMNSTLKHEEFLNTADAHGEISNVSCASDNMLFKVTSLLVQQTNSSGGRSKSKIVLTDPSKYLHGSIAEVGSFNNLPKSDPTGRSRVNPFLGIGEGGLVQANPKFRKLLESVQDKIKR